MTVFGCAQLKEQCALTLGYMAVGDPLYPDKKAILLSLFETKEEKAFDLQVTVGEAISCVAAGRLSTASHDKWTLVRSDEQRWVSGDWVHVDDPSISSGLLTVMS